jgi:chromosomal replication initiation ATPase DnaA
MVDAFNSALDENGDLGVSLAIAFEAGNAIMRSRSTDMTLAERIVATVAGQHSLDLMSMYSRTRAVLVSHPRFIAWWLIRKHLGMSYPAIGAMFKGFNHVTVLKGCRHVEASPDLMAGAREIEKLLSLPTTNPDGTGKGG